MPGCTAISLLVAAHFYYFFFRDNKQLGLEKSLATNERSPSTLAEIVMPGKIRL